MAGRRAAAADPIDTLAVGVHADFKAEQKAEGESAAQESETTDNSDQALADAAQNWHDSQAGKHEAAFEAGLERLSEVADNVEMTVESLGSDLRDAMLEIFKHRDKPWQQHTSSQQRDIAASLDYAAKAFMRKAVVLIASKGREAIGAKLETYTDKAGEITAKVKIVNGDDDVILGLHRASGKQVLIVTADVDDFMGDRPAQTDADEPELGFEAGSDTDEDIEEYIETEAEDDEESED